MAIYKGENLLATSANSDTLVRNPDWGNAVTLTIDQLWAGYTAPSDGFIAGYFQAPGGGTKETFLTINDIEVASSMYNATNVWLTRGNVQAAVAKNDVIKFTTNKPTTATEIKFVPYGLYTAPDTLVPHSYSQDEQFTGNYWIDGKKIYRKCFSFNRITVNAGASWHTVITASVIPGVSKLLNYKLISDTTDWTAAALARFNSGNFQVYPCAGLNISIDTVILEYTKTTD